MEQYLAEHEKKELLRFVAVGSVDDGKSTLIGRLLHDTHGVYEDQLEDARQNATGDAEIDFALITDGLAAEREQGITIDVAYRYFSTATRKFIIADTPGHVQYTRNMATGASTADVCVILIDARLGVLQQSRRHAYIASMLGIPHLFVCVNKMDLIDFEASAYHSIRETFEAFAQELSFRDVTYLPISALAGDNVVSLSERTPWYAGRSLLEELESVSISEDRNLSSFRLPVQYVIRPDQNYRGFAGQVASGAVQVGDTVVVHPSGKSSTVQAVEIGGQSVRGALTPQSVTLRLEDEIDVSRGDLIVGTGSGPLSGQHVEAMVVWLGESPSTSQRQYLIKHTTRYVRATLSEVVWQLDVDSLEETSASALELNDIGCIRFECNQALHFDPYRDNRSLGAFVIVDTMTNNTVGAGMLLRVCAGPEEKKTYGGVTPQVRSERLGFQAGVVMFSGVNVNAAFLLRLEARLFDQIATVIALPDARMETRIACGRAGAVVLGLGGGGLTSLPAPSKHDPPTWDVTVSEAQTLDDIVAEVLQLVSI